MPLYQVIVLAVVQGLTEFLPVSSSAHLALVPWLFGWQDPGLSFDIALHLGTLAAVLIYFFKDWVQIIGQAFGLRIGGDSQLAQQPKLLRGLTHGAGPQGSFDYVIVLAAVAVVLFTLVYAIKFLVRPGEREASHIKRIVLNQDYHGT